MLPCPEEFLDQLMADFRENVGIAMSEIVDFPDHPLPGGPTGHLVLVFPAPSKPVGVNDSNGKHWSTYTIDKRLWLEAGREVPRTTPSSSPRTAGPESSSRSTYRTAT